MADLIDKSTVKRLTKWAKKNHIDFPSNPEEMGEMSTLDLKLYKLKEIPKELCNLSGLKEIDLSYNQLSKLPKEFSKLSNLETLNINQNHLQAFPEVLLKLKSLKHLEISGNQIEKLPDNIDYLENLEVLDCKLNTLKELPGSIGKLEKLKSLNAGANHITQLPSTLGDLVNLESLNVWANKLTELPKELGKLHKLVELAIWSNKITTIPQAILDLPKLESVDLMLKIEQLNEKLIEAAQADDLSLAQVMISCGADPNYKWEGFGGYEFTTALFEAHSVEMAKLLVEHGANPHAKRKRKVDTSVKVWETNKEIEEEESFMTINHSLELTKYKKSIR